MMYQIGQPFQRKPFIPDGIRPLDLRGFQCVPTKCILPKLSPLVPKFHGEWDESAIDHLNAFYTFVKDYEIDVEHLVMKLFIRTLWGYAREAYESLPTQSISSMREFEKWFLYEFHVADDEEDDIYYKEDEEQICNMEEESCISPLDAFFDLERYNGESIAGLLTRMINIYVKIPIDSMPSFSNKMDELGISHDPELKCIVKSLERHGIIWTPHKVENTGLKKEEGMCVAECKEEEETLLSTEEISYLLEKEYERYCRRIKMTISK